MLSRISPPNATDEFYKSFQQLGGSRPEPKTDVLFVKTGKKYKCSMKWGDAYQFSSAGIEGTVNVLNSILFKVTMAGGLSGASTIKVAEIMDELSQTLGEGPRSQEQSIMKAKLEVAKRSGGLNDKLQSILGSRKNPNVSQAFLNFKKEILKEALTGNIMFNGNDNAANYILSNTELKPINDALINSLVNKVYVDIRLKGRGSRGGVRLNEAVVRIEPV
jgi:membrane-associated HD superfamily phosphohydrolase